MSWGRTPAENYLDLLGLIPDAELNSPRRSVVPLVDFWREPDIRLRELAAILGFELRPPVDLIFEHAVAVQKGRGKASFTDLMILTEDTAVAVEAKFTEPEYQSVSAWLGGKSEGNRPDVLDGWLGLINRRTSSALTRDGISDLPYQLIHRTASACSPQKARAALVYLVFGSGPPSHYGKHLRRLATLLQDRTRFSLHLLWCPLSGTSSQVDQMQRWNAGERALASTVRMHLSAAPLFLFGRIEGQFV
jgi:hypothetical protein